MRAVFSLAALLAGVVAASCASAPSATPDENAAPEDAVIVEVVNNSMADVDVFVLSSTTRQRVGRVDSLDSGTLEIPRELWAVGSFRIQAVPLGMSGAYATGGIQAQGGDRVKLTLEADPSLSSWMVVRGGG